MPIARITGQGLAAMALLVVLLWGCIVAERLMVRQANLEASQAIRALQLMQYQKRAEPASTPRPRPPVPARRTLG